MRIPAITAAATAVLIGTATPAGAEPVVLAGETTLQGTAAGFLEVTLPKPHPVFTDEGSAISAELSGGNGVVGAVLLEAGPDPGRQRQDVQAIRLGPEGSGGMMLAKGGPGDVLAAGPYHLYLFADAPGRVVLRFAELEGAVTVTPDRTAEFDAGPLVPRLGALPTVTKWGRSGRIGPAGGIGLHWALPRQPDPGGRLEGCWYPSHPDTAPPDYEPTCPNGLSTHVTTPDQGLWTIVWVPGQEANDGFGGNLTQTGMPLQVDAFAMWASFDRSLAPGAAPPAQPRPEQAPGPADPPPQSSGQPPPPIAPMQPATVASHRVRVRGRVAHVRVRCPGPASCRGRVRMAGRRADFLVKPGKLATLRVRLPRGLAARVKPRRGLTRTVVVETLSSERWVRVSRRVRLHR